MIRPTLCLFLLLSFCCCCNLSALQPAQGADRFARLQALEQEYHKEHDIGANLQKEIAKLTDQYRDLAKKHDSIQSQIDKHQREVQQAQQKKRENDKKKDKSKGNNDKQLDQQIRADQQAIEQLKKQLGPIVAEGKQVKSSGEKKQQALNDQFRTLWNWRSSWADASDISLSESREAHAALLAKYGKVNAKGPIGDAWALAKAISQAGSGDYEPALKTLEPLVKDEIWRAKASSFRAYVYLQQGESGKVYGEFGRAVQFDNDDPHYYLLRGIADVQSGKHPDARRMFDQVDKLTKISATLLPWRAYACALESKPSASELEQALQWAEKAVQQENKSWLAHDALAAAYAANQQFPKAVASEQTALKLAPAEHRAACEARMKDYQGAQRHNYTWR